MSSHAIIVGIGDYPHWALRRADGADLPGGTLPAAVDGALVFLEWALTDGGIPPKNVWLHLSDDAPTVAERLRPRGHSALARTVGGELPIRPVRLDDVLLSIREVYRSACTIERFFFYFAGHGFSFGDAGLRPPTDALAFGGFASPRWSGRSILRRDALVAGLRRLGPADCLLAFDCCRNLLARAEFDVSGLGMTPEACGNGAARAVQIMSARAEGFSVDRTDFAERLVSGLRGEGEAKDWRRGQLVVDVESLGHHLRGASAAVEVRGQLSRPLKVFATAPRYRCELTISGGSGRYRAEIFWRGQRVERSALGARHSFGPLDAGTYRIVVVDARSQAQRELPLMLYADAQVQVDFADDAPATPEPTRSSPLDGAPRIIERAADRHRGYEPPHGLESLLRGLDPDGTLDATAATRGVVATRSFTPGVIATRSFTPPPTLGEALARGTDADLPLKVALHVALTSPLAAGTWAVVTSGITRPHMPGYVKSMPAGHPHPDFEVHRVTGRPWLDVTYTRASGGRRFGFWLPPNARGICVLGEHDRLPIGPRFYVFEADGDWQRHAWAAAHAQWRYGRDEPVEAVEDGGLVADLLAAWSAFDRGQTAAIDTLDTRWPGHPDRPWLRGRRGPHPPTARGGALLLPRPASHDLRGCWRERID